jgi:hypothetical protein
MVLRLNRLSPVVFSPKTVYAFLFSPMRGMCLIHIILLNIVEFLHGIGVATLFRLFHSIPQIQLLSLHYYSKTCLPTYSLVTAFVV